MTNSMAKPEREESDHQLSRREYETAAERRVQVAAAKLRVALDARLGRKTPPATVALAKEDF